jgi:hypothetical protein
MRRFLLIASAALLLIAAAIVGYRWFEHQQSASRRLATFQSQQEADATYALLDRMIALDGRDTTLQEFADLIATSSGLPVELDEPGMQNQHGKASVVQLPKGNFSLRAALAIVLQPRGLWADVRGRRLVITTRENSTDLTSLRTVVYPLPQPEPSGLDEPTWHEVIRENVDPGSWDVLGGPGHIESVPGALVIVQTSDAHRRIRQIIGALARLDETTSDPFELPPLSPGSVESQILAALDGPTTMEFTEQPLKDVVQYLALQHQIPIVLLSHKLREASVSTDIPITKNLDGISLRAGLRLLLNDLELVFLIRNEALIITTPEDAESHLRAIVYPVHDIVLITPEATDFDSLIDLITNCVSPQSWNGVGGPATLRGISKGWLLVQQTDYVHEEIQYLLAQLRRLLAPGDHPRVVAVPPESDGAHQIRAALNQQIELKFQNAYLRDAFSDIQERLAIPIVLNAKKLEEAAVSPDTRVNCDLPLGRASLQLELLLAPLELQYVVRNEVLQITTPEDTESQLLNRLYDLRPLLAAGFRPTFLEDLVTKVLEPHSWDRTGGPGSACLFRDLLVVGQTESPHRQIEALLAAIERHCLASDHPATNSPPVISVDSSPARDRIEQQLQTPTSVDFQSVPLHQALTKLAADHNLALAFKDESALTEAPNVTFSASDMTLGGVLQRLLQPRGMKFTVREHVLWIAPEQAYDPVEIRLYWVGDFAEQDPNGVTLLINQMLNANALLGLPIVRPINKDWLVIASGGTISHARIADWLTEHRTGQVPKREAERRAAEKELRPPAPITSSP